MARRIAVLGASLACALLGFAAVPASAQSNLPGQYFNPATQAPPVTVRKALPFTDSGTNAPVGYENDYVVQQTALNQPTYQSYLPDSFGQDVLPGRFGEIGRGY